MKRFVFPVFVLAQFLSLNEAGLLKHEENIFTEISEDAFHSANQQLERISTINHHSRARRDAKVIGDDKLCKPKLEECQKLVSPSDPNNCVDVFNASKCVFHSFTDNCVPGSADDPVASGKYVVAGYLQGFLSVSCHPNSYSSDDNENHDLSSRRRANFKHANKCVAKYFDEVMRAVESATIANTVCCGQVEFAQCISSRLSKPLATRFVASSYKRFARVSRNPEFGFPGCGGISLEDCSPIRN